MNKISTKDRIIDAALTLFSKKGYDSVSVEQIAGEVGMKAPSLYKHFKGKQAIFDAIIQEMERRYDEQMISMKLHFSHASADGDMFSKLSEEDLVQKVQDLILYSLHDNYVSRFRRLLTIEQFRNQKFAELYTRRYVTNLIAYHQELFELLIQSGVLKEEDPEIMSLQYVSPICVFLSLCDRHPEKEADVLSMIQRHIKQFNRLYAMGVHHESSTY